MTTPLDNQDLHPADAPELEAPAAASDDAAPAEAPRKRRGGMMIITAIAVLGVGGAAVAGAVLLLRGGGSNIALASQPVHAAPAVNTTPQVAQAYITQQRVQAPAQVAPTAAAAEDRPAHAEPAAPPPPQGPTLATDRHAQHDMQGLY